MKYKVVIACGPNIMEFVGLINNIDQNSIVMNFENSEILINRKFVVFMQTIKEENKILHKNSENKIDLMNNFVKSRLRHDPLDEKIEMLTQDVEEMVEPSSENLDPDDIEVMNQVRQSFNRFDNLADNIKFSMDSNTKKPQVSVKYENQYKTFFKDKNVNNKKI